MKRSRLLAAIALIAIALSVMTARRAFAIVIALRSANVSSSADYPASAEQQVQAALQRKDCKFLRGIWINGRTTIHYAGNAASLNGLVGDLVKCPGVTVSLRFRKLNEQGDWLLLHDARRRANSFEIQINLNSKRIDLENLVLPTTKGPEL